MQPAPEPEEPLPESIRLALRDAHEALSALMWSDIAQAEAAYARLLTAAVQLAQAAPASIRSRAIELANGQARPAPVKMTSEVRLHTDYDSIEEPLLRFFDTFGQFRYSFMHNPTIGTLVWSVRDLQENLLECSSFYHMSADIDSI